MQHAVRALIVIDLPDTAATEFLRQRARESAQQILGSIAAVQALHSSQLSQYLPVPDTDAVNLDRVIPPGLFQILVWHGRVDVVQTTRPAASEQQVSTPVMNAHALGALAMYVVLAAGGDLTTDGVVYAAPEWLIRQVEALE